MIKGSSIFIKNFFIWLAKFGKLKHIDWTLSLCGAASLNSTFYLHFRTESYKHYPYLCTANWHIVTNAHDMIGIIYDNQACIIQNIATKFGNETFVQKCATH